MEINNRNAEVIDELNKLMDNYQDLDMINEYESIKSFYEWYVEKYIY